MILQGERNYIMQVVCEATQSPSAEVEIAAFECLVKIMSLFYDKMQYYMERALFGVSCAAVSCTAKSRFLLNFPMNSLRHSA